ncbi:MAG: lipopolysaccharide transport system ATP-binding protein [Dokdonia sp.]|jgi:lipopolysaccharide transport system ATP-binding protein
MSDTILKVDNISKQYRLGTVGTGTISHDLNRWWHTIRGKEDPYLKIGAVNDRSAAASSEYVWALQDINFEVKRGEVLGIIGKNGAGKSTLLKILSRVTSPTTGKIQTRGKIASLLEVGTGMHPELTGRENIFLNGAILGMTKTEIFSKIDDIVEFSGCQMYIDTPVKRYSSGMRVRLGFAVAAFLEPEIMVVDEVLAVGDAEFQKKAIGKMKNISEGGGKTVLFVSHNMASIRKLCSRGIILEHGKVVMDGDIESVVDFYLKTEYENTSNTGTFTNVLASETPFQLHSVKMLDRKQDVTAVFLSDEVVTLKIKYTLTETCRDMRVNVRIITGDDITVFTTSSHDADLTDKAPGDYEMKLLLPKNFFNKGNYKVFMNCGIPNVKMLFAPKNILEFDIEKLTDSGTRMNAVLPGITAPGLTWHVNKQ